MMTSGDRNDISIFTPTGSILGLFAFFRSTVEVYIRDNFSSSSYGWSFVASNYFRILMLFQGYAEFQNSFEINLQKCVVIHYLIPKRDTATFTK